MPGRRRYDIHQVQYPFMSKFSFRLQKTRGNARAGEFTTAHGVVPTPIYMPVGTQASVKAMDSLDVEQTKSPIILANTYHLYLRPGTEELKRYGGLHNFMRWDKPILTDSGGFQVFSLGMQMETKNHEELLKKHADGKIPNIQSFNTVKINDEGVEFTSHWDGSKHFFSPEKAIEIQRQIGADIIMAFDECTPDKADLKYTEQALDRTHRWATQCFEYWEGKGRVSEYGKYQALFGIIQGAMHKDLRRKSAQHITNLDFDGIAVGGETIGYNMEGTVEVMEWLRDILPEDKPRYAMGLGRDPQNLIDAVEAGFDMFDCVAPTRMARNGALYHGELAEEDGPNGRHFIFKSDFDKGRLNIGNTEWVGDDRPIQEGCDCYTCKAGYSRGYLRHLFKMKELAYYRLSSIHNVRFMVRMTEQMRAALLR
jgi:queuine tRNA-ribosyltransferase